MAFDIPRFELNPNQQRAGVGVQTGTTEDCVRFVGHRGQMTFDGELTQLRVHDGVRQGGHPINPASYVLVSTAYDIADQPLQSDVVYLIDGTIDIGTGSIRVPEGGLTIEGTGFNVSRIITSEPNAKVFIVDPAGSYSGDLLLSNTAVENTGVGSVAFELDNAGNFNAIEFNTVNFNGNTSLGEFANYRQALFSGVGFFGMSDGLTFSGTWAGGLLVSTSIIRGNPASAFTLWKAGADLMFAGRFRSSLNAQGQINLTVTDFAPANFVNDGDWQFNECDFRGIANPVPNATGADPKCVWRSTSGLRPTFRGGMWSINSAALNVITQSDTLVKMAGTTITDDLQHFTDGGADNALTYVSEEEIEFQISGILSFGGGNNDQLGVQIRQWDDSASAYVDRGPMFFATLNGGFLGIRAENVPISATALLGKNDRIEVWIMNATDRSNITSLPGSLLSISERV